MIIGDEAKLKKFCYRSFVQLEIAQLAEGPDCGREEKFVAVYAEREGFDPKSVTNQK